MKKRFLAAMLSILMIVSLLPTAVLAAWYDENSVTIKVDQTTTLKVNEYLAINHSWKSKDPSIVTVSGSGDSATIKGIAEGTTTVTCTYDKWNSFLKRYDSKTETWNVKVIGTSTITFIIQNGYWTNPGYGAMSNSGDSDGTPDTQYEVISFEVTKSEYNNRYVYECKDDGSGKTAEDYLTSIADYVNQSQYKKLYTNDEGYMPYGYWTVSSGGTVDKNGNSTGDSVEAQIQKILSNTHGYDDHMEDTGGFAPNTVYIFTLYPIVSVKYDLGEINGNPVLGSAPVDNGKYYPAKTYTKFTKSWDKYSYTTETITEKTEVTVLGCDVAPEGYRFVGWSPANSATIKAPKGSYSGGDKFTILDNTTLVAQWKPIDYTVTYKVDGVTDGTVETGKHAGDTIDQRTEPTKDGYTFSGWNEEVGAGVSKVVISDGKFTMPARDVVFVGTFEVNKHNITYSWTNAPTTGVTLPAGATDVAYNSEQNVDSTYTADSVVYTHDTYGNVNGKYTFSGWDTDDATVSGGKFTMPDKDVTLVGEWEYKEVEVVEYEVEYKWSGLPTDGTKLYDADKDEVTPTEPTDSGSYVKGASYTVDSTYTADSVVYTHDTYGNVNGKYTFSGWKLGGTVVTGAQTMGETDVTLVGEWTYTSMDVDKHIVSYKFEGEIPSGITTPIATEHYYNETDIKVAENPSADGYTFSGWKTDDVDVDDDGTFTMPAHNVVFVGKWTVNKSEEYTVTYYVNGRIYDQQTYAAGEIVTILSKPVRSGYVFDGWHSDDVDVFGRTFVMPDKDVIIEGKFYQDIELPIIDEGKIEISKVLSAPEGYTGKTSFTFQIWRVDGYIEKLVEEIEVEAGDSETVTVDVGNYYICEVDAEEEGYNLTTSCSANNNKVRVVGGRKSTITFKNIYTEIVNLETEDHFGYIIGYPDGTVRPEANITRAEVATIFFRMLTDESRDFYWSQENKFSDVNSGDWFNNAISTLTNAGILSGYSDGTFRPNEPITRAELVKIAVSFYSSDAVGGTVFADTDGHWADIYINAAYALEFIDGYDDGTFKPDQDITRAEAMKIINRTLMRAPHEDHLLRDMITWVDNVEGKWYYAEVQEATNSHSYDWHDNYEIWTEILPVRDWAALESKWSNAYSGN